jgi:phytoene dehydrogenase-like protein
VGLELAVEAETNKWFPASNSSREVRNKLVAACQARGVQLRYEASVEALEAAPGGEGWTCRLQDGAALTARRLVGSRGTSWGQALQPRPAGGKRCSRAPPALPVESCGGPEPPRRPAAQLPPPGGAASGRPADAPALRRPPRACRWWPPGGSPSRPWAPTALATGCWPGWATRSRRCTRR